MFGKMNFMGNLWSVFVPILKILGSLILFIIITFFVLLFLALLIFFVIYRVTPFSSIDRYKSLVIKNKWYDLLRWVIVDQKLFKINGRRFPEFGFTIFSGRQGDGKTVSIVEYLERMHEKYPKAIIVTNFKYAHANRMMTDWRDLLDISNGDDGVIFAIDEIHSEYSSSAWKDFPESILSEISQQRKQAVKIIASSQVFTRVVKPIREQTFTVILCKTYFKRFTVCREYDATEFSYAAESAYTVKPKIKPISKYSFVQTDALRSCYDTYEKISRMKQIQFIPRAERGQA